jgi:AGZA family xanthine/uracil permease-like MFS transporter
LKHHDGRFETSFLTTGIENAVGGAVLERLFRLREHGTTPRAELRGGIVTFLAMAYVIFVNPGVLSNAGMDFGAVMVATCVSAAAATALMGLLANYPIALASGMGENFFFVAVATGTVTGTAVGWRAALAAVFASGVLFLGLGAFRVRERIFEAIPSSLKDAIGTGIGLLVAFIGLKEAGLIVAAPGTLVRLGHLGSPSTLLALGGLVLTVGLHVRGNPGAVLFGMLATAAAGLALGLIPFTGIFGRPPSIAPVLFKLDLPALLNPSMAPVVMVFLFMALFDTVGTLVGVGSQAGLVRDGKLARAGRAFVADASGTTLGALLGTSTVTAYIESSAGVTAGGRTGLSAIVTAVLFLLALFFGPAVKMIGGGVSGFHPVTAPALILVGALMNRSRYIAWEKPDEAFPAFLVVLGIPLTFSIADGLALGFIAYPILKLVSGKAREVHPFLYAIAGLFVLRYALL